jgi:hypothetical protein
MTHVTVREVLGEPSTWSSAVTASEDLPNMRDAFIMDIYCSGNEISMLTISARYGDTLSVFRVPDPTIRERVIGALRPGESVIAALDATI